MFLLALELYVSLCFFFFFQAEDGIRDLTVTGVQTCALPISLATMSSLQRFRGHFYNWYDTRDLRPLDPRYVSSVDSGNLAAHLLALANACREWIDAPLSHREPFAGIDDALTLAREALRELPADQRTQAITHRQVEDALHALAATLGHRPAASAALA